NTAASPAARRWNGGCAETLRTCRPARLRRRLSALTACRRRRRSRWTRRTSTPKCWGTRSRRRARPRRPTRCPRPGRRRHGWRRRSAALLPLDTSTYWVDTGPTKEIGMHDETDLARTRANMAALSGNLRAAGLDLPSAAPAYLGALYAGASPEQAFEAARQPARRRNGGVR